MNNALTPLDVGVGVGGGAMQGTVTCASESASFIGDSSSRESIYYTFDGELKKQLLHNEQTSRINNSLWIIQMINKLRQNVMHFVSHSTWPFAVDLRLTPTSHKNRTLFQFYLSKSEKLCSFCHFRLFGVIILPPIIARACAATAHPGVTLLSSHRYCATQ